MSDESAQLLQTIIDVLVAATDRSHPASRGTLDTYAQQQEEDNKAGRRLFAAQIDAPAYWKAFVQEGHDTDLTDLLYSQTIQEIRCEEPGCFSISRGFEASHIFYLDFPANNTAASAYDLENLLQPWAFTVVDDAQAHICERDRNHTKSRYIYRAFTNLAEYVCFAVRRGFAGTDYLLNEVTMPGELDLGQYTGFHGLPSVNILGGNADSPQKIMYDLVAVDNWIGSHFIAYVRKKEGRSTSWVMFNDLHERPTQKAPFEGWLEGEVAHFAIYHHRVQPTPEIQAPRVSQGLEDDGAALGDFGAQGPPAGEVGRPPAPTPDTAGHSPVPPPGTVGNPPPGMPSTGGLPPVPSSGTTSGPQGRLDTADALSGFSSGDAAENQGPNLQIRKKVAASSLTAADFEDRSTTPGGLEHIRSPRDRPQSSDADVYDRRNVERRRSTHGDVAAARRESTLEEREAELASKEKALPLREAEFSRREGEQKEATDGIVRWNRELEERQQRQNQRERALVEREKSRKTLRSQALTARADAKTRCLEGIRNAQKERTAKDKEFREWFERNNKKRSDVRKNYDEVKQKITGCELGIAQKTAALEDDQQKIKDLEREIEKHQQSIDGLQGEVKTLRDHIRTVQQEKQADQDELKRHHHTVDRPKGFRDYFKDTDQLWAQNESDWELAKASIQAKIDDFTEQLAKLLEEDENKDEGEEEGDKEE